MSAISELVSKYGTSLEETRKLLGKIRPEISKLREERNLLLSQPVYLTPSEAKEEYGITLEENYKLKLTPDNGKYTASLLTPGGWEMLQGPGVPSRSGIIYPHESFISPEGKKFTREEFEAQFTTPEPEEEWYKGGKIPAYEFPGIETQFETPDYAKLQQVFGKVYPERDIEEIAAFADEQPEEFLATIRDVGQTEDTEYLLKAMFRGITDEQMAGFFEGLGEKEEFPTAEERQAILFEDLGYNPAPPVQSYEERQERSKAFQAYRKAGGKLFADQWELYGMPVSPAEELPMLSPQEHQAVIDREVEKSTNLLKLLGEGLTLLPKQVAASVLQAVQGQGGASVVDRNWADDLISDANDDIQEFTVKLEANYGTANLPINPVDLATLPQNMAFSITSMGAGIGIGVPIALAPVPGARIAAWLTGSAASGAVAYNMTSYQIMQQYLEAKNEEMIAATGRGLTAEEEEALKEGFETQARNYGLWEAIPEAVSNLLFGKILTAPLVKVAGKNIATKIIVKLVELYGEELLTETITQKGQSNIEVEAGLRDGKINWVEAFKEVAPQTFLLTTIMGGTGQIGITSVNKIKESLHKEIGGTPIHDVIKENITEDVFSGIEAESGKVEGITPEQIKTITEKTDQLMIELPESKDIIADAFAPNWLKDVLQHLAKIPVVGTAIEKGIMTTLGPRELVRLDSKAVEDIVAKAAILRLEIQSMGTNARAANVWGLRSISSNPVKLFGFDENAISKTIPRVSDKATGTLEDIFIHPELYKLTEKQLAYVNKVHEVNMEIYRLLNKEGVAPRALSEDWWIHRVVVGKYNADGELAAIRGRPGMKGKTLGAKRAYEMHRKAPTMAEGIAWGIKYGRNPEDYVGTYVEEAFNKIADARFAAEVAEFGEKPSEILAERYPDIVKKATLTTKQLADIKKLDAILGRAIRGERLPEQTLRAMERRFPDWGRKLRGAVQESIDSERKLGEYISYLKRQQTELQSLLAKKQTKEAVAQAKTIEAVPEEHKLVEAFKVMDYEDRVAYRSVMEEQMADIEQMSYEYTAQIEALQESLAYDPVARWRGKMPVEPKRFTKKELAAGAVRKRKFKPYKEIKLTDFLVRGEWPETITIKQAKALLGGEISLLPNVLDKTGKRVKWEYILDQLVGTDEFRHMGETEFIHHVEQVKADFNKLADFQSLENLASARIEDIQKILGVLDSVDVAHGPVSEITPEVTPPAAVEPAVIPEGVRPPLYIADLEGMMPKNAKRVKAVTLADGGELVLMSSKGDIYGLVNNQEVGFVTKLSATETDLSVAVEYRNRGIGTELLRQFKLENPGHPTGGLTEGGRRVEEKLAEPTAIPKATEGMPEAGLQKGMFGYNKPVFPKGKGKIIQISMDDYGKLSKAWKDAGLPGGPDNVGIKPKVEGIKGLEAETTYVRSDTSMPKIKTPTQRIAELKALKVEAKLLMEQRKAAYWKAKGERTAAMEKIRQPGVEQGYIMQPMFGGKIYDTEFIDSVNKFFGHKQGIGALRFTSDFAGILRITKAAMDFSVMAIQGMPGFGVAHSYLLTNPKIGTKLMGSWFKAFTYQVGAFFNPDVISGYMSKNKSSIMQRIAAGGSSQSVDYFEALGAEQGVGGIMAKAFQKDPLRLFPRAETSFFTGGEMIRDEFWKILRPLALEKGEEFELARALDRMTGIIDSKAMAVPLTERQVESSFVWFAPRYTRACSSLVAHTFRGGFTGAQARRAMSGMIAAGAIYYSAVTFALALMRGKSEDDAMDEVEEGFGIFTDPITGEVEWKPSARFMTLKIGNYYFGLGGFWYGLVRLTGNILACVNEVGTRERIDFLKITKYGGMNRDNPFLAWWYSRSSPLTGTIRDLVTGRNFLGTPIETPWEYAWYTANRFTPIWIEQGVLPYFEDKLAKWLPNVASQNEMPEDEARILTPVAEIFGLRTFPQNNWSRFYDMADEIIGRLPVDFLEEHYTPEELKKIMEAQAQGKLTWAQLNKTARMALLSMYPELDDFYKEAQGASLLNDSDAWKQWNERIEEERRIRNKRIDNATERFLGGEIDAREWDRLCDEAEKLYGKAYEDIEKNPAYAEVRDYFEKQEAKGDKYDWADDVALAEYESQVMFASDLYDETSQTYDWDERDRRVADFIDKWGMDVYERVLWYRREKKKDSGLNDIRVRHAKDLELLGRDYWNLPYKAIYTMDDKDKAEGSIPVEYLGLWEEYQRLEGKARDEFLQANPSLNKDWRAEWRAAHPEDDARLKLWGYGGDLQSKEAYDILRGWTKEFKLSSESQVLMKLPPENIVAPFFDYKDVQRVSGGNSAEARLFRLEHEAFNEWGKEAYGWKDVDDNINVLKLSAKWRETDDKYDALETTEEREAFLEANSEYADDRRRKDAYGYEFPDNLIETYVEYYKIDLKGYADDWFLMEHPEFYNKMLELEIWTKEKDFSKVPTKEVYALYQTYQGLPTGQPRVDFRARYPKLDDWLVLAFGYKPISDRGKEEAAQTPWDKAAEAQTIKNWLDSL